MLINDSDWELEGEGAYVLQDGDSVAFISTLHGERRFCQPRVSDADAALRRVRMLMTYDTSAARG